jgi:hypothetical protein
MVMHDANIFCAYECMSPNVVPFKPTCGHYFLIMIILVVTTLWTFGIIDSPSEPLVSFQKSPNQLHLMHKI